MFRLVYFLKRLLKRMWVRSALFCAAAVLTAGCSFLIAPVIPEHVARAIGADSVDSVPTVLASSMLAVTTFSLATMVSGYSSASSSTSPRSTRSPKPRARPCIFSCGPAPSCIRDGP